MHSKLSQHWDTRFSQSSESELGWFERDFTPMWQLLNHAKLPKSPLTFIAGAGVSKFAYQLEEAGHQLILNDISGEALTKLKNHLNGTHQYLNASITAPMPKPYQADVWLDRAVLHFLTDQAEQKKYRDNLLSALKPGGYLALAQFAKGGATRCAGLPIVQYDVESYQALVGNEFHLVTHFAHTFINPYGEQKPYCYALFQRQ